METVGTVKKSIAFQHYFERKRDTKGSRRKRAMPIAHEQISVVIDGRSIVEAYTKRRLLHDLVIRHPLAINLDGLSLLHGYELGGQSVCLGVKGDLQIAEVLVVEGFNFG